MTLSEWLAALSQASLESADEPARAHVTSLLASSPLPLALFRSECTDPFLSSAAWRSLFGTAGPWSDELQRALRSTKEGTARVELRRDQTWGFAFRQIALEDGTRGFIVVSTQLGASVSRGEQRAVLELLLVAIREAEDANRAKDEVLATVSHELRGPVSTIVLWENALRDHIDDPSLRIRALDAIRDSAKAQARLVDDLLDISRAISGRLCIERIPVSIDAILGAAIAAMVPTATAKSLVIESTIGPRLGHVIADPARLRQVFDNLLSNAVKFTPAGGTITVEARRERGAVVVTVSDTGCGIEKDVLVQLFTPFFRPRDQPSSGEHGLGLGLAIAKRLVDLHEGTLTASSAGRDRGSSFTLTLPLARRLTRPPPPRTTAMPRLDGIRVLVVDDEPYTREVLALSLTHAGATVVVAKSAAEARELLAETPADVLVCDISMPVEDGYTFMRALRESAGDAGQIPAIALTAYAFQHDRERAVAAGFDAHLAKPVQLGALASEIAQLVGARS
jgi:signal transduction histidine kinase/ActR/RegA family two-component response regulator